MKYTDIKRWVQDVHFYFPTLKIDTTPEEYLVVIAEKEVAFWNRIKKVGFISITDSVH